MREVLFRGKRIDNGEWVYGYLIAPEFAPNKKYIGHLFSEDEHDIDVVEVDPETVGQFTGLYDNNGLKIFEGDIMFLKSELEQRYGIVEFGEYVKKNKQKEVGFFVHWNLSCLRTDIGYWANQANCEVIGNIHDNPELMEVKQNDG